MFKNFIMFALGGSAYTITELLWRGYSHISMFALGGICFVLCGSVGRICKGRVIFPVQCVICAAIITLAELIVGYVVNIKLGMYVWSYYGVPYNFMGQICLPYGILWILLSGIGIRLNRIISEALFV